MHISKINNPEKFFKDWKKLDPRKRKHLMYQKWPSDIQRQKEQLEILEGILGER